MKILITGASGFIGSYLVEEALNAGMEVWAAVRQSSSRQYLQDSRIRFFYLDLRSDEALATSLDNHVGTHGPWDYVVHAAGATKCRTTDDFRRINTEGTLRLARLLVERGALRSRFVFISSLSIVGAVADTPAEPSAAQHKGLYGYPLITDTDTPQPNTAYGRSKWEAEKALADIAGLDYVILRPTGVYGPRERDYFLMAKSICQHVDFAVGYRPQALTFIYVKDLVQAALLALNHGESGRAYFLTDGGAYPSRAFSDLLQRELGVPPRQSTALGASRGQQHRRKNCRPPRKNLHTQSRQVPNHEAAQLAVRHFCRSPRTGLRTAISVGARRARSR